MFILNIRQNQNYEIRPSPQQIETVNKYCGHVTVYIVIYSFFFTSNLSLFTLTSSGKGSKISEKLLEIQTSSQS